MWCGQLGVTINHHYPIQKQDGGTDTIRICANCHHAAHTGLIINASEATDEADYLLVIETKTLDAIKDFFPILYSTGQFYEPFERKMIVNPIWKWQFNTRYHEHSSDVNRLGTVGTKGQ